MSKQKNYVFFCKIVQALWSMPPIQRELNGTFISNREKICQLFRERYSDLPCFRYPRFLSQFSKATKHFKAADVIITAAPHRKILAPFPARKVMINHGTQIGVCKEYLQQQYEFFDQLLIIGPREESVNRMYQDEIPLPYEVIGYLPFCQFPKRTDDHRDKVLRQLGLDPGKKTIVYASSRRRMGSWEEQSEAIVKETPTKYNLVVRPHPSVGLSPKSAEKRQFQHIVGMVRDRGNALLDLNRCPLQELLSITDVLVSDMNSTTEESLFYDTPQIIVESLPWSRTHLRKLCEHNGNHHLIEQFMAAYDMGPTYSTTSSTGWQRVIEQAIDTADSFKPKRDAHFEWVFGSRATCTEAPKRAAAALYRFATE